MPTLPPVPDDFYWVDASFGPALRCGPLDALGSHLFSTRQLQLTAETGWTALADSLGVDARRLWRANQVHGNQVIVAAGDAGGQRADADALISADPSVALAVVAADCVPLLMADAGSGAVAVVHAGWRGTAARVAVAALDAMQREFGTTPGSIVAAIGPAIGACCYEVGPELVDAFAAAGHERSLIARWFHARPPRRGEPRSSAPQLRLDVAGANRDQLVLAGVPEDRIHVAGICTAMHVDIVTSYRIERENAVRIAGAIRRR